MPYIKQERRHAFERSIDVILENFQGDSVGELTYVLTKIINGWLKSTIPWNYTRVNAVLGALSCTTLEFYRQTVAPYEDLKKEINGDVF